MEDKQLNPEQSFALIQQMIGQTRQRVERNAGVPFLIFGYLTVAVSLAVWGALTLTNNPKWHLLWLIISAAGLIYWLATRRKEHTKEVSTYVDRIIGYIWKTVGIVAVAQSVIAMFVYTVPILYIILLLMGMQMTLTGLVIQFRTITIAGVVTALVLSPLFLFFKGTDSCLLFAAVFLVMMVIPGHILNYKSNHPCSKS